MTGVQVLVLAAGAGSRFRAAGGDDKLQAPLPGHPESTVLQATFRLWKSLDLPCLVVVASGAPWRAELAREEGLEVLTLPTTGMGDSLAAAVRATPDASGWLVALGDMPFVQPATARQLLALHDPARVVVPVFQEKRGHPVLFGRNFAAALGDLQGDEGAKRLLRQASVLERKVTDAGIHLDIDTPADLEKTPSMALELPHFAVLPTQENATWGKTIMNTIESMLDYLKDHELQLTTAESCTAGKVVGLLSEIPGSGSCIESGYVVYSPEAKQRQLWHERWPRAPCATVRPRWPSPIPGWPGRAGRMAFPREPSASPGAIGSVTTSCSIPKPSISTVTARPCSWPRPGTA